MTDTTEQPQGNERGIGDNNPPDEFTDAQTNIENLYGEAKNFLDGDPIDSESLAEGVTDLLNQLRAAGKETESLRVEEKRPHDAAAKAVQDKFRPLSDKVQLATDTCKEALQPWLVKKADEKAVEDARLQAEADEAARLEREAREASRSDDLGDQEALAEAEKATSTTTAIAKKAKNTSGGVKVGGARAVGLRTYYETEVHDGVAAARYYWKKDKTVLEDFLLNLAKQDVRAGAREIPGFTITEKQKV